MALRAARQWGVVTRRHLLDDGFGSNTVDEWCAASRLFRVHRGVYSVVPRTAMSADAVDLAAVFAAGDGAVLCGRSAAVRWGMLRFGPPVPQVLVATVGRRRPDGIDLRTTTHLPPADRTVRDAIPITTVERTLLDLAGDRTLSDRALESAAAQAERDGRLRRPVQLRVAARSRHRSGAARLRTVLRVGPRLWRSDEEAMLAAALVAAGFPEPVIAHVIATDIGPLEVDLCLPEQRRVLEVDGAQHGLALQLGRDADRDDALARAGWHTVRVPARLVRERPADAVARATVALPVAAGRVIA